MTHRKEEDHESHTVVVIGYSPELDCSNEVKCSKLTDSLPEPGRSPNSLPTREKTESVDAARVLEEAVKTPVLEEVVDAETTPRE